MRKIALLFGAAVVVASGALMAPAQANTNIVEELYDDVRARVCQEEHGYGVVDCSQEVDPTLDEVARIISPVAGAVSDAIGTGLDTATWALEEGPGIVEEEANYVYCWVVDPENPYCRGIIR